MNHYFLSAFMGQGNHVRGSRIDPVRKRKETGRGGVWSFVRRHSVSFRIKQNRVFPEEGTQGLHFSPTQALLPKSSPVSHGSLSDLQKHLDPKSKDHSFPRKTVQEAKEANVSKLTFQFLLSIQRGDCKVVSTRSNPTRRPRCQLNPEGLNVTA